MRFRRRRVATLGAGIIVAAVGFVLLTATAATSSLHVHGTLKSSFRPAYDILVRPRGAPTDLEREERLVRPNFLSGVFGGITVAQWHKIEGIHGVAVAAPVANIGYLLVPTDMDVSLNALLNRNPFQIYRIRVDSTADDGLSQYSDGTDYVYYTPRDPFTSNPQSGGQYEVVPGGKPPVLICADNFTLGTPGIVGAAHYEHYATPFPASPVSLFCYSRRSPESDIQGVAPGRVEAGWRLQLPVLVSAIDPKQESKLLHLDRTVVSGKYLAENEGARIASTAPGFGRRLLPALVSSRTFADETVKATVERLNVPAKADVPAELNSRGGYRWMSRLSGRVVARKTVAAQAIYEQRLHQRHPKEPALDWFGDDYWVPGSVEYRKLGPDHLAPKTVSNPASVWLETAPGQSSIYWNPPRANADTQFRGLHHHVSSSNFTYVNQGQQRVQINRAPELEIRGTFDPSKLQGFSPLSKVPLETYYPPVLAPADSRSARLLHGKPLQPSENIGGYIQQPPLVLTTLTAARWFYNRTAYTGVGHRGDALISAIRVKVAGVTGPDPLSLERVKVVAQKIHAETGLTVDITAGSSPHPVEISLPKGRFGRPALLLREGWSKKGVTVSFLRALDRKDLALFGLILVICGFFLGNGALAAVRARRAEIGTLLTFGWSRLAIFRAVLAELLLVGLVAGAAGAGLAAVLVEAFSLRLPLLRVLLVVPIALLLALVAGAVPAWLAARGLPMDALRPPVIARGRARPVRRLLSLSLVNLTRLPARTLVGASGLTIGVAALAVLVGIERAFQGTLVGTLLGNAVSLQVRSADFAAIGLTIALAALSVADVVYLNLRERQAELVTLRTLGWSNGHLRTTVLLESLGLGLLGSLGGALLALIVGAGVLSIPLGSLALAATAAAVVGTAAALLASLAPLSQISRLTVPTVLAAE